MYALWPYAQDSVYILLDTGYMHCCFFSDILHSFAYLLYKAKFKMPLIMYAGIFFISYRLDNIFDRVSDICQKRVLFSSVC